MNENKKTILYRLTFRLSEDLETLNGKESEKTVLTNYTILNHTLKAIWG